MYLPNDPATRNRYLQSALAPLAACARADSRQLVWGGDYNFCPDSRLNRRYPQRAPPPQSTQQNDSATQSGGRQCTRSLPPRAQSQQPHTAPPSDTLCSEHTGR